MNLVINPFICEEIGIKHGQERGSSAIAYKNFYWSIDYDRTFFGQGDLSMGDLDKIYGWLCKEENQAKVFTAWDPNHGTHLQETKYPLLRISFAAGVTSPDSAIRTMRVGLIS